MKQLEGLIAGSVSREAASTWAAAWVDRDDVRPSDLKVWEAVKSLMTADLPSSDRPYLYSEADFSAWLEELRG